jgi:FkbM family methyltransferase
VNQAVTVADNRILCRVLDNFKMFCDSRDMEQMPHLAMEGVYNQRITDLVKSIVRPGMACCDVGAGIGYMTAIMADAVGPRGSVHAFEPGRRMFTLLKANMELNTLCARVSVSAEAMGDQDGVTMRMLLHKRRYGAATMSEKAQSSFSDQTDSENWQDVNVTTLDKRLGWRGVAPDFFLIQVNGYEAEVFKGMHGLLRNKRKVQTIVELYPHFEADHAGFMRDIFDQGFNVSVIGRERLIQIGKPEDLMERTLVWLLLSR